MTFNENGSWKHFWLTLLASECFVRPTFNWLHKKQKIINLPFMSPNELNENGPGKHFFPILPVFECFPGAISSSSYILFNAQKQAAYSTAAPLWLLSLLSDQKQNGRSVPNNRIQVVSSPQHWWQAQFVLYIHSFVVFVIENIVNLMRITILPDVAKVKNMLHTSNSGHWPGFAGTRGN